MRFISIFGAPGAGKTTAAIPVAQRLDAAYISSGDIARRVDPGSLAVGKMADRALLRNGFVDAILDAAHDGRRTVVIDGLPRDPTDVNLLPPDTLFVLLSCKPSVSIKRQSQRGREGDEAAIIKARTDEQYRLMALAQSDGWAYRLAGNNLIDTTDMTRDLMMLAVYDVLYGMGVPLEP